MTGSGLIFFDVIALTRTRKDEVDGQGDDPRRGRGCGDQGIDTLDVDPSGVLRVVLTRFELARAFAVEHPGKLVLVEEPFHAISVVGVEWTDTLAPQLPVVDAPGADDLPGMFPAEIVESVVAGDTGYTGDEHGKEAVTRHDGRAGEGVCIHIRCGSPSVPVHWQEPHPRR